jgi:hypothetical protein
LLVDDDVAGETVKVVVAGADVPPAVASVAVTVTVPLLGWLAVAGV